MTPAKAGLPAVPDGKVPGLTAPEEHPPLESPTRKKLATWDRIKFLLLLGLLYLVLVWAKMAENAPLMPFNDALRIVADETRWIFWLMGLEIVRQIHFLVSEYWDGYH